jgi:hypothetical protein
MRSALERVVLDYERVGVTSRGVEVGQRRAERHRVTLAIVRILFAEVSVHPSVVRALNRGADLSISALIDVRRRIGRLCQHRRSHGDCKQKKCCSEHAARPVG